MLPDPQIHIPDSCHAFKAACHGIIWTSGSLWHFSQARDPQISRGVMQMVMCCKTTAPLLQSAWRAWLMISRLQSSCCSLLQASGQQSITSAPLQQQDSMHCHDPVSFTACILLVNPQRLQIAIKLLVIHPGRNSRLCVCVCTDCVLVQDRAF